jgi:branched-chain amino acid transport system permease protein
VTVPGVLGRSTLLRHLLLAVIGGAALFLLTHELGEYRNSQLATIAYFACATAGLTVLTGLSGQVSIGHGAFMFIGAYTAALFLKHDLAERLLQHTGNANYGLIIVLLAALVVCALVGAVVGVAAARLRGPYLAGITLALAIGIPVLPLWSKLEGPLGGHAGLPFSAPAPPTSVDYVRFQAWICCLSAVIVMFLLANLSRSRVGRAFRAVRDDEISASLAGLSVARVQVLAFVVSAACAGLAGGLFAVVVGSVGPASFPLSISFYLLAAIVFGGLGSLAGAVYGAVLITLLPTWSTDIANSLSLSMRIQNNLPLVILGGTLIVAMLAFPSGVQGLLRRGWGMVARRAS